MSDEQRDDVRQLLRELDRLRDAEAKHLEANAILAAQLAAVRARAAALEAEGDRLRGANAALEANLREYGAVAEECTRLRALALSLSERCEAQAALLAKKAEVAA